LAKFSRSSLEKLETCHPALQVLFRKVIIVFDCTILCGLRTKEEQNQLFEARPQKTRCQWPDSKHNVEEDKEGIEALSTAVDAAPYYIERPHIRWDEESLTRWYYFAGIVKGIAVSRGIPIRWGGDWDRDTYVRDQKFNDLPHFELFNKEV
jgi:peptidoglycan L-alanyl-D-glutamate endopeptidase CwlK